MKFLLLLALIIFPCFGHAQTYGFKSIMISGTSVINDLGDVDTSGKAANDILAWDGSNWVVSQTTVTTGSTISGLDDVGDVSAASPNTGDLLSWNGSNWVNQTVTDTVSTTTMTNGWPDAIKCNITSPAWGEVTFFATHMPYSGDGKYRYRFLPGGNSSSMYEILYASSGAYDSALNLTTHNCNVSISSLYSSGRAFNFIGNNGASTNLNEIGDVNTTGVTTNDILAYDGSNWVVSQTTVGAGADDLGDHTATQNIALASYYLSGDGGDEGIYVDSAGQIGVGTATPNATLDVAGTVSSTALLLTGKTSTAAPSSVTTSSGGTTTRADLNLDTTDDVAFNTVAADVTGDLTGNVVGNVTGNVTADSVTLNNNSIVAYDSCTSGQVGQLVWDNTLKIPLICTPD